MRIDDSLMHIKIPLMRISDPLMHIEISLMLINDPLIHIKISLMRINDPLMLIKISLMHINDPLIDIKNRLMRITQSLMNTLHRWVDSLKSTRFGRFQGDQGSRGSPSTFAKSSPEPCGISASVPRARSNSRTARCSLPSPRSSAQMLRRPHDAALPAPDPRPGCR